MEHLSSPPKRHICFCFVSLILALSTAAQVQNGRITEVVSLILLEQLFAIIVQNPGMGYEIDVQTNEEGIFTTEELEELSVASA